jgi:hypothetical protein
MENFHWDERQLNENVSMATMFRIGEYFKVRGQADKVKEQRSKAGV